MGKRKSEKKKTENTINDKKVENICVKSETNIKSKMHKFKKKKLKQMCLDSQNQETLSKIELLISLKNNWNLESLKQLFCIMHNHFDVSFIYVTQIEKSILEFVDIANDEHSVRLAALCFSKFSKIKKSNTTALLQKMILSLWTLGKEYFDYFNMSSNFNDMTFSFESPSILSTHLTITDDTVCILINRINFVLYTIQYIFQFNYNMKISVPYNDLYKCLIGFICITPQEIVKGFTRKSIEIPYYVSLNIWNLIQYISSIHFFRSTIFEHVSTISEIIKLSISETFTCENDLKEVYIICILRYLNHLIKTEGKYCLTNMCSIFVTLIKNTFKIVTDACSDIGEMILINYLECITSFWNYHVDADVTKCIETCKSYISHIRLCLVYMDTKSIYQHPEFQNVYRKYLKLTDNDLFRDCNLIWNSAKFFLVSEIPTEFDVEIESATDKLNLVINSIDDSILMTDSKEINIETHKEQIISMETESPDLILVKSENCPVMEKIIPLSHDVNDNLSSKVIGLDEMLQTFVPN